jgi:hypothetical protein
MMSESDCQVTLDVPQFDVKGHLTVVCAARVQIMGHETWDSIVYYST